MVEVVVVDGITRALIVSMEAVVDKVDGLTGLFTGTVILTGTGVFATGGGRACVTMGALGSSMVVNELKVLVTVGEAVIGGVAGVETLVAMFGVLFKVGDFRVAKVGDWAGDLKALVLSPN